MSIWVWTSSGFSRTSFAASIMLTLLLCAIIEALYRAKLNQQLIYCVIMALYNVFLLILSQHQCWSLMKGSGCFSHLSSACMTELEVWMLTLPFHVLAAHVDISFPIYGVHTVDEVQGELLIWSSTIGLNIFTSKSALSYQPLEKPYNAIFHL